MIEYGTIAIRQFPKYEKYVLGAMIRQQMYEVLKLIVETNKRQYRKTALTELDIAQRIRSWLGHCCHANAGALVQHILSNTVFMRG